jgi:hypothetical protein
MYPSQVLVYFAVAKLGDAPVDGKTDVNPEGLTAGTGRPGSRLGVCTCNCLPMYPGQQGTVVEQKAVFA